MKEWPWNIGFVSTRLSGTDGVSLESAKWEDVLTKLGYQCFYFAGESDRPEEVTYLIEEARFRHPDVQKLNKDLFDDRNRSLETSEQVSRLKGHLKQHLHRFVDEFDIDLIIVENALSIPMNVPLGLAITEFIAETNMPTIAHHHDFTWERTRYAISAADDYLRAAFPPTLSSIRHVVINSFAGRELALRTGASSVLIPNVMDFSQPAPQLDTYAKQFRSALEADRGTYLLFQPTRIVPRKRIEIAIELTRRLDRDAVLVISHGSGDEGTAYQKYLDQYAKLMDVRVIYASDIINHVRGLTGDGRRIFALADAYHQIDLATYPSAIEGFGNAFLEVMYYRRPIVINNYEIFRTDIQPKGFRVIGFDGFITDRTIEQTLEVLDNPGLVQEMTDHNFTIARQCYSFHTLERNLVALMSAYTSH
jgi:glycosyltransferase involved in cell wall biosynthesis